ncbi:hypothetical protein HanRHA438_Chr10g0454021 [Helianthus annuus]|nr:hypothetical protein HanRHA438_Chr10g0454021 [Helianthus annuus]
MCNFFQKKNVGRLGENGGRFGFPEFSKNFRVFYLALPSTYYMLFIKHCMF